MSDNNDSSNNQEEESNKQRNESFDSTRITCDALFSLSAGGGGSSLAGCCGPTGSTQSSLSGADESSPTTTAAAAARKRKSGSSKEHAYSKQDHSQTCCPKQLQLPMFLSKTYHMIDRCDSEVAGWGDSGDSFVVKNVEKFASNVLPLYFKHSNFSSFARQLNFYGFRKLRSDPILTSDVDPHTACYVRFFHEHFQKDKPELLHQIKRATKTDQQSKDEVDSLKAEVSKLREQLTQVTAEYDRKLAELSYDCNRRISAMTAEQDKLALLVQQSLGVAAAAAAPTATTTSAGTAVLAAGASHDLLHSLSQAAMSLQRHLPAAATAATTNGATPLQPVAAAAAAAPTVGTKRAATTASADEDATPPENGRKHPKATKK